MNFVYSDFTSFVRKVFDQPNGQVILHDPRFIGNERKYLMDAMDSNFVSSVGEYVGKFEKAVAAYTGAGYAVAAVNGTSALHISLLLAGVEKDDSRSHPHLRLLHPPCQPDELRNHRQANRYPLGFCIYPNGVFYRYL